MQHRRLLRHPSPEHQSASTIMQHINNPHQSPIIANHSSSSSPITQLFIRFFFESLFGSGVCEKRSHPDDKT